MSDVNANGYGRTFASVIHSVRIGLSSSFSSAVWSISRLLLERAAFSALRMMKGITLV